MQVLKISGSGQLKTSNVILLQLNLFQHQLIKFILPKMMALQLRSPIMCQAQLSVVESLLWEVGQWIG